jgi:hypothetical protein
MNKLPRVSVTDIRVESVRASVPQRITITVAGTDGYKAVAEPYDYPRLLQLAQAVYAEINIQIKTNKFGKAAFSEGPLVVLMRELNNKLYALRFTNRRGNLGELLTSLMASRSRPVTIAVDGEIGLLPWELTSPNCEPERSEMLGTKAYIVGDLGGSSEPVLDCQEVPTTRVRGRAQLTFDSVLKIRAAGNASLEAADEEREIVEGPGPFAEGSVAPEVTAQREEASFFTFFGGEGYQIAHFFCHCDYNTQGFYLQVSRNYSLGSPTFDQHRAEFKENAFHFVNVCAGAPTPNTKGRSFLDYLSRQQQAGGILASLTNVRSRHAVELARAFYNAYLPKTASEPGMSAAEALWEARRGLASSGSLAGYLYRVYGRPDTYLVPLEQQKESTGGIRA